MKPLLMVINDPKRCLWSVTPISLHVPYLLVYLDEFRFIPSLESLLRKALYGLLQNGLWVWKLLGRKYLLSPTFQVSTRFKSPPLRVRSWKTTRVVTSWSFSSRSDLNDQRNSSISLHMHEYILTYVLPVHSSEPTFQGLRLFCQIEASLF